MVNNDHLWRIKEALRELELALIGVRDYNRERINKAIEHLSKFEEEYEND